MLNRRLKNIVCFINILAILFLFAGHNFIHHAHDEEINDHFQIHTEEDHQDEHESSDMSLNTHLHLFYSNSNSRNLIAVDEESIQVYVIISSLTNLEITENKLVSIYHKSDNPKPQFFSSTLKDRSPPLS